MAKVLVTGGSGFIGSHLVEALCLRGDHVTVIDNLHTGKHNNLSASLRTERVHFLQGDILDQDLLTSSLDGVETVFHLAARISVPESLQDPLSYVTTNTLGTLKLLEACWQANVRNIVFSSSAAVYGNNPIIPKNEAMLPEPQSPYALTKFDGEYYFNLYREMYHMNAVVLRYFNVFGPRQDPSSPYAAVVPLFIEKALRNEDIVILGDGEQTRDFIYVKDVVQANLLAAEKGGELFNVAYGQRCTINELARLIIELTGSRSKLIHKPARINDIKHSQADITRITDTLGFLPYNNLRNALTLTIESMHAHA